MTRILAASEASELSREFISLDDRRYVACIGDDLKVSWSGTSGHIIRLEWLKNLEVELGECVFNVLVDLVATRSPSFSAVCSQAVQRFWEIGGFETCPVPRSALDLAGGELFPTSYGPFLVPTLRRMMSAAEYLFSPELVQLMNEGYVWEKRGSAYAALMANCPESGALTEQELFSIQTELNKAYAARTVSIFEFTLCWFVIATGLRPIQIARMLKSDVIFESEEGRSVVKLRVPLAKGEATTKFCKWTRRSPTVLASALVLYRDSFAFWDAEESLFGLTSDRVRQVIQSVIGRLPTMSERLGTGIQVTPYRFRYTAATRAIEKGATDWQVARLLTHRATGCIKHYRASSPTMQAPIAEAVGKELKFFANAFQGRIIGSLAEATRQNDGGAEILDFLHVTGGTRLGACGTRAECYQNAPVACLTCPLFEPFAEAPWEELMSSLVSDADAESDEKIRSINLAAMSAVREIIGLRDASKAVEVISGPQP